MIKKHFNMRITGNKNSANYNQFKKGESVLLQKGNMQLSEGLQERAAPVCSTLGMSVSAASTVVL